MIALSLENYCNLEDKELVADRIEISKILDNFFRNFINYNKEILNKYITNNVIGYILNLKFINRTTDYKSLATCYISSIYSPKILTNTITKDIMFFINKSIGGGNNKTYL